MIEPGRLRHRVRVERLEDVPDSNGDSTQDSTTGEVTREWTLIRRQWAAIEPLSAREFIQSQAPQSAASVRITLRWFSDLDGSIRLVYERTGLDDVVYNVLGVLPDKDDGQEYVTLPCSVGVGDGR